MFVELDRQEKKDQVVVNMDQVVYIAPTGPGKRQSMLVFGQGNHGTWHMTVDHPIDEMHEKLKQALHA
jgi:hypothetical protein